MKVSIIIPVYNVELYIAECIQSVISQDYADLECVIVNDCTLDNSMSIVDRILDSYHGEISFKIINKKENSGLSTARNIGVQQSSGDYILFIDSDDFLVSPSVVSTFVKYAYEYPDAEIITGRWCGFLEHGNYNNYNSVLVETSLDYQKSFLRFDFYGTVWNRLIKRNFIVQNGILFDEGLIFEDTLWVIKTFPYLKQHVVIPYVTYHYRSNPKGLINNSKKEELFKGKVHVISVLFNTKVDAKLIPYCNYYKAYNLLALSYLMIDYSSLGKDNVKKFNTVRGLFARNILFSHPIYIYVGLMLCRPFRLLLANMFIRNKTFTILSRYIKPL